MLSFANSLYNFFYLIHKNSAKECYQKGFTVIVTVLSRASDGSRELIKTCQSKSFFMLEMNLVDENSIQCACDAIDQIIKKNNLELHAMVNNAAVMYIGEFEWSTADIIKEQVHVNLMGHLIFTNKLLPTVRQHKSRLINVASHCSIKSLPGFSTYSATKAAIKNWSEALQQELQKFGVKVIIFIPGKLENSKYNI